MWGPGQIRDGPRFAMTIAIESLRVFSILSFAYAGIACLRAPHMKREFDRYGLSKFRLLTGFLQLAGAAGLVVGFFFSPLTLLAAGGLGVLMFLGVGARLRVNDSLFQVTPAAFLSIANLMLLALCIKSGGA